MNRLEQEAYILTQYERHLTLWVEVIAQAVRDAERIQRRALSRPLSRREQTIVDFINIENESFIELCAIAETRPQSIIKRLGRGKYGRSKPNAKRAK